MDRKLLVDKLKTSFQKSKKLVLWACVFFACFWAVKAVIKSDPLKMLKSPLTKRVNDALVSVQTKVDELKESDSENQRLKVENLNLRRWVDQVRFDCRSENAIRNTKTIESKLEGETGTTVGRVLASIDYRPPTHLMPEQIFTLGVSYFKAREHEKAAVIFTYLTGLESLSPVQLSQYLLLAGVSWYRLDHLKLAEHYFGKVLAGKTEEETLPYLAQARLWKGLVSHRLNRHGESQNMLRELLDYHPHSIEAAWINGLERASRPASGESESEPASESWTAPKEPLKDLKDPTDGESATNTHGRVHGKREPAAHAPAKESPPTTKENQVEHGSSKSLKHGHD